MIKYTDILISVFYVVSILALGLWSGIRHGRKSNADPAGKYFLAGRTLRWPAIGLALFATNISTVHLVSLAQSGFDTGLLNGSFEWMASFTLVLFAIFFVPFYIRSGVATLPDFLERRYDRYCRDWLVFISLVSAVIIHIAFSMLAGGIVLKTLFGVSMYTSVIIISAVTALYTIIGGLKAVVVTESIQTIVLITGAVIMSFAVYNCMGGWQPMVDVLHEQNHMEKISMLHPNGSSMPWYSVFLGYPVLGIWYWCADQTIVQRVLGAKNEDHARAGAIFCGFIKILPVFIFVFPGLFAYTLAQSGKLDISTLKTLDASGKEFVNSRGIYTLMVTQLLPKGIVGIVVAALLSGLMSQVSGALNSISTIISYDLYKRYHPGTDAKQMVRIAKIGAGIALIFSLALLPLLNRYESIFIGINDIIAHIAPPITCVFLLGIFWKKASAKSARLTLWLGSALGAIVFTANKIFTDTSIAHIPFMMMAFWLFCICFCMQVGLSYLYPVQHTSQSEELYWRSIWEPMRSRGWKGFGNYKTLSAALLLIMGILFWIFR